MADPCFPAVWAPKILSYFSAIMSLLLSVPIVIGNLLIVIAVIKDPFKRLKTPFSFFLVNLACCDLLVGFITMPISFIAHLMEARGTLLKWHILSIHFSYFISTLASILSLAALCLDRYFAIMSPIQYRETRQLSLRRCVFISICIWIIAGSFSVLYLGIGYVTLLMVFVHTAVGVTLVILILTYVKVYRSLRSYTREIHSFKVVDKKSQQASEEEKHLSKREKAVTGTFLGILVLFICSYTPAIVMIYILQFCLQCSCTFRHILRDLQFLIISANSMMNPIICSIRLKPFRRAIISMLKFETIKSRASSTVELKNIRSSTISSSNYADTSTPSIDRQAQLSVRTVKSSNSTGLQNDFFIKDDMISHI